MRFQFPGSWGYWWGIRTQDNQGHWLWAWFSFLCVVSLKKGGHITTEGFFVTSGAMLCFVKESILTTHLNKAGKTIVPLVVLAINLLLCKEKIGCLNDVIIWPGKEPMELKDPIVSLTQWWKRKTHLLLLFQREEGTSAASPPTNTLES